jgi:hypothetical protein
MTSPSQPARFAPVAALAVLAIVVLGGLTGCFGQDAAHPDRTIDRQFVGYHLYRGCMAEAGWMIEGSVDIGSDQTRFAHDDQRCAASAQLFVLPSLAERVRMYHDELGTVRCLGRLDIRVKVPTLSQYLDRDVTQPWSPYLQLEPYSPEVLTAMQFCPDADYRT